MKNKVLISILLISLLLLTACGQKGNNTTQEQVKTTEQISVIQDDEFLAKAEEFEADFSNELINSKNEQSIGYTLIYLESCANKNACLVGKNKETLLADAYRILDFNMKKVDAYKARFQSYTVSSKLEPFKQEYIIQMDLTNKYFNNMLNGVKNGNYDVLGYMDSQSWYDLVASRKKTNAIWQNLIDEAKLQKI